MGGETVVGTVSLKFVTGDYYYITGRYGHIGEIYYMYVLSYLSCHPTYVPYNCYMTHSSLQTLWCVHISSQRVQRFRECSCICEKAHIRIYSLNPQTLGEEVHFWCILQKEDLLYHKNWVQPKSISNGSDFECTRLNARRGMHVRCSMFN